MRAVLLSLFLFAFLRSSIAAVCTGTFTGNYATSYGGYISWNIDCVAETITVNYAAPTQGWIAVGWNEYASMGGADIAFAWVNSAKKAFIVDALNGYWSPPTTDSTNNLQNTNVTQNSTHTTLRFTKKLNTNDTEQDLALSPNTTVYLIAAMGTSDPSGDNAGNAASHSYYNRVATEINFFEGQVNNATKQYFLKSNLTGFVATAGAKGDAVLLAPKKAANYTNQLWSYDSDGFVTNAETGHVLDIKGGSTGAAAPVITWDKKTTNNHNQKWSYNSTTLVFASNAGKVLDVKDGSTKPNNPLIVYPPKLSTTNFNQRFELEESS